MVNIERENSSQRENISADMEDLQINVIATAEL